MYTKRNTRQILMIKTWNFALVTLNTSKVPTPNHNLNTKQFVHRRRIHVQRIVLRLHCYCVIRVDLPYSSVYHRAYVRFYYKSINFKFRTFKNRTLQIYTWTLRSSYVLNKLSSYTDFFIKTKQLQQVLVIIIKLYSNKSSV